MDTKLKIIFDVDDTKLQAALKRHAVNEEKHCKKIHGIYEKGSDAKIKFVEAEAQTLTSLRTADLRELEKIEAQKITIVQKSVNAQLKALRSFRREYDSLQSALLNTGKGLADSASSGSAARQFLNAIPNSTIPATKIIYHDEGGDIPGIGAAFNQPTAFVASDGNIHVVAEKKPEAVQFSAGVPPKLKNNINNDNARINNGMKAGSNASQRQSDKIAPIINSDSLPTPEQQQTIFTAEDATAAALPHKRHIHTEQASQTHNQQSHNDQEQKTQLPKRIDLPEMAKDAAHTLGENATEHLLEKIGSVGARKLGIEALEAAGKIAAHLLGYADMMIDPDEVQSPTRTDLWRKQYGLKGTDSDLLEYMDESPQRPKNKEDFYQWKHNKYMNLANEILQLHIPPTINDPLLHSNGTLHGPSLDSAYAQAQTPYIQPPGNGENQTQSLGGAKNAPSQFAIDMGVDDLKGIAKKHRHSSVNKYFDDIGNEKTHALIASIVKRYQKNDDWALLEINIAGAIYGNAPIDDNLLKRIRMDIPDNFNGGIFSHHMPYLATQADKTIVSHSAGGVINRESYFIDKQGRLNSIAENDKPEMVIPLDKIIRHEDGLNTDNISIIPMNTRNNIPTISGQPISSNSTGSGARQDDPALKSTLISDKENTKATNSLTRQIQEMSDVFKDGIGAFKDIRDVATGEGHAGARAAANAQRVGASGLPSEKNVGLKKGLGILGALGGFASKIPGLDALTGGILGAATTGVDALNDIIPSYDSGGFVHKDMLANIHAGEYVMNPNQLHDVVNNYSKGGGSQASGEQLNALARIENAIRGQSNTTVLNPYGVTLSQNSALATNSMDKG